MPHNHGKRQFAKNSTDTRHFRLVARSQHDPEGENEEVSGLVLEPFVPFGKLKKNADEDEHMRIPESLQSLGPEVFGLDTRGGLKPKDFDKEHIEDDDYNELDEDCYFPQDGYNYNQHLRTLSKNKKKGGVGGIVIDAPKKQGRRASQAERDRWF